MAVGKLYIGRKVRELRQANRATQAQFAERIGISISYLNQIENNQRPVSAAVLDRKSTRLNSSHRLTSRMPSSA
jgi:transcriptional regulator with XRE-family HTH domain